MRRFRLMQQRQTVDPRLHALTRQIKQLFRPLLLGNSDVVRRKGILEVAVRLCNACGERQPRCGAVDFRRPLLPERGFPGGPLSAPEIEDVRGGQIRLFGCGVASERLGEIVRKRSVGDAGLGVERRVKQGFRQAGLRRRLPHARVRRCQIGIFLECFADQCVQRLAAQSAPPAVAGPGRWRHAGEALCRRDALFGEQLPLRFQAGHVRTSAKQGDAGEARQYCFY